MGTVSASILIQLAGFFFAGIIGGLLPGAHMNSLVALIGGAGLLVAVGLSVMQAAHSVTNFIPATFLGAPTESTSLSTLPAHRLFLKGEGYKALYLSLFGAVLGCVGFIAAAIPVYFILPSLSNALASGMGIILSFVIAFSILGDAPGRWLKSTAVFALSGIFGVLVLRGSVPLDDKLFCMLAGAFGIGGLAFAMITDANAESKAKSGGGVCIPEQKIVDAGSVSRIKTTPILIAAACGTISGLVVGVLPATSTSHSVFLTLTLAAPLLAGLGEEAYIIAVGASQTSNFLFSVLTLRLLGKARNGTIVAISESLKTPRGLTDAQVLAITGAFLITILFAILLASLALRPLLGLAQRMNRSFANALVIIALLAVTFLTSGFFGLLVALTSASIGILCVSLEVRRTHVLGMLLIPTLLFYLGL